MLTSAPGGQRLLRSDIALGIRAAARWSGERDVPDVLAFEDFCADPNATHERIIARFENDTVFLGTGQVPLPKPNGTGLRPVTVMHPYDELAMRTFVGRCSAAIEQGTDPGRVLNHRVGKPGRAGWYTLPFREQHGLRRALQRSLYDRPDVHAVGFFDVKGFFPACGHDHAERLLVNGGAPRGAVEVLIAMLGRLFPSGKGLPIGFEGSGPIANLFLARLDRELAARGYPFCRWTDDVETFLRSVYQWDPVCEVVVRSLTAVDLEPNTAKCRVIPKGPEAEARLFTPGMASMFEDDSPDAAVEYLDDLDTFEAFGFDDDMDGPRLRSILGRLRSHRHPGAAPYLYDHSVWLDREPRAVANYLIELTREPETRKAIDVDWLIERVVDREPAKDTTVGHIHALRVLTHCKVSKENGQRLLDAAWAHTRAKKTRPVGAWAVRAWSTSQGHRVGDALEIVDGINDFSYQRAAVAGMSMMRPAAAEKHLRPLAKRFPDLRPVISMVTT